MNKSIVKKTIAITLLLCALCNVSLFADEAKVTVLTVEDAVAYALENSRTLQSAVIDLEIKTRAKNNAWNVFIPSVQVTGTMSRSNEVNGMMDSIMTMINPYYTPTEKNPWTAVGGLSANLNLSLALIDGIRATKANYEAGLITWDKTLKETELNVRKMFYALLLQQESLLLQTKSLANAQQRVKQAEANYKNGIIPELSLLQAQVSFENQKPVVLKQAQSLQQQLDLFAFLIGLPSESIIQLEGKIQPTFIEELNADELITKHMEYRLDLEALEKNIELLKISKAASEKQIYTPALALSYSFQPVVSDIEKNWLDNDNWSDNGSFSATLAWNLTNMLPFSSARQKVKDTKAQITQLELTFETVRLNAEMEIRKLVDSLDQSKSAIEASKQSIALAQKSYDLTVIAYQNGTTELLDLRDAENQLNQAKLGLASEQYNYLSGLLDLEYSLNTKLGDK